MSKFKKLLLSSCISTVLSAPVVAHVHHNHQPVPKANTQSTFENMTGSHLPLESETISDDTVVESLLWDTNNQGQAVPSGTFRWNYGSDLGTSVTVNYAFRNSNIGYYDEQFAVHRDFSSDEEAAIKLAMSRISESVGITFNEVFTAAEADFMFYVGSNNGNGADYPPSSSVDAAQVRHIKLSANNTLLYFDPNRGSEYGIYDDYKTAYAKGLDTTIHELGHILGLKHPFDGNTLLPENYRNKFFTVMDYNLGCSTSDCFAPTSLKKMDVLALQHLYGKSKQSVNAGNDIHEFDDSYDYHQMLVDSDGDDTISLADATRDSVIDLRPTAFSSIVPNPSFNVDENLEPIGRSFNNFTMHIDTKIENVTGGSGDDELIGNELANELSGGSGDDFLKGLEENDYLDGGEGVDTAVYINNKADYTVEINSDHVLVTANLGDEGSDTLVNIEKIQFVDETMVVNSAPVIEIEDQEVLSGSAVEMVVTATDAEGDTLNFAWLQKSGIAVELDGGTTDKASFIAPRVNEDSELTFDVMVNDPHSLVTDTVTITIKANNAPVIEDIDDQTQDENKSVSLTASATDAENDEITYRWEQTSGTTVTLSNSNTANASFTAPAVTSDEKLTFTVYVSDGMAETSTNANVTVKNVATNTGGGSTNNGSNSDSGGSGGGSMSWLIFALSSMVFFRRRKV